MTETQATEIPAPVRATAIQEIETLRRLYARATDQIGLATEASIAEGRATYHRIFTPDVAIRTAGMAGEPLNATGPDRWVEVVLEALTPYAATQHLIGTQLVELQSLELDAGGAVTGGEATMTSYIQAWHATPANEVWVFIGTYHDKARLVPGTGWRIYDMTLEQVSEDHRSLGARD